MDKTKSLPTRSRLAAVFRPVFFVFAALSFFFVPFASGLAVKAGGICDLSWLYGLHLARAKGMDFFDIYHTHGPLTFLLTPLAVGPYWLLHCCFVLGLHALLVTGLALRARRTGDYPASAAVLFFLLAFSVEMRDTPLYLTNVLPLLSLVFYILDLDERRSRFFLVPAGLAAFAFLIKLNIGIALTVLFGLYLASSRQIKGDTIRQTLAKASFFLAVFGITECWRGDILKFPRWAWNSLDFVRGYSEAMASAGEGSEVLRAVLALLILLPAAKAIADDRSPRWAIFWLGSAGFFSFYAFKNAFVRCDVHLYYFCAFFPVILSSALLLSRVRKTLPFVLAAALICALIPASRADAINPLSWLRAGFSSPVLRLAEENGRKREMNARVLGALELSAEEKERIGSASLSLVPVGSFNLGPEQNWKPDPVFDYFAVYTEKLDNLNVARILGEDAADFVVFLWGTIDRKHPLFNAPGSYLALLDRYDLVGQTGGRLLLKKRSGRAFEQRYLSTVRFKAGEVLTVPPSDRLVVAKVRLKKTLWGRLVQALLRAPEAHILLDDGREWRRFRFIPGNAGSGLIVNFLPQDLAEMRSLFISKSPASIPRYGVRIRFDVSSFSDAGTVDFYELAPVDGREASG